MSASNKSGPATEGSDNVLDVFLIFLRLGLTSFGGPVAHIVFFAMNLSVAGSGIDTAGDGYLWFCRRRSLVRSVNGSDSCRSSGGGSGGLGNGTQSVPQLAWAISPRFPCAGPAAWNHRVANQSSGKNPSALLLFIGMTI